MTPQDTAGHIVEDFRAIINIDQDVITTKRAWAQFYLKTSQRSESCSEDLGRAGIALITQHIAHLTRNDSPEMFAFLDALKAHAYGRVFV